MSKEPGEINLKFPLWQYLCQPLFSPGFKSLNPLRFRYLYNLEQLKIMWAKTPMPEPEEMRAMLDFLEACWSGSGRQLESNSSAELIKFLERCWGVRYRQSQEYWNSSDTPLDEEEYH